MLWYGSSEGSSAGVSNKRGNAAAGLGALWCHRHLVQAQECPPLPTMHSKNDQILLHLSYQPLVWRGWIIVSSKLDWKKVFRITPRKPYSWLLCFLFRILDSWIYKYVTFFFSTDHLRLVNFSPVDQEVLKTCIMENYHPGVARVDTPGVEDNSLKFDLRGSPSFNLHARSLLVHLFAAAVHLGFQIVASVTLISTLIIC